MNDLEGLQAFCAATIRCDLCGTEGGEFMPAHDKFICPTDRTLIERVQTLGKEEQGK